jgi:hypothetical protein
MTPRSFATILVCLLSAVAIGQRTVAISSCTSSHGQDHCHEAFDGISTGTGNGWRYQKPRKTTWGKFQLAEASDVSGVSILSVDDGKSMKKFSIECYQGETVVPVTNVRLISGQAKKISGKMVDMKAKKHSIRVDFDPVPGCTAVELKVFKTFAPRSKHHLALTELSILTGTVFSQVAAPGACLATEIADIGKVFGNSPHTIQVRLTFPESDPNPRQWLLNLGQHSTGANQWLWNSNTQIQFGKWGGSQIETAVINECTHLTTTSSGSVLKLYCDGVFMAEKNTGFSIDSPQLSIGVVPSSQISDGEADFAGCITEVAVHSYEKSAAEVAQQNPPAFWKTCRWQSAQDQHLRDTQDLMGWTCADNEILTGFKINLDNEDEVLKIHCCELGGHSSVISDTCTFVEVDDPEDEPSRASCDANDHMVFSGAYDRLIGEDDDYTEVHVGKCCAVKCDAPWCHCKDWGVNTDQCLTVAADPDDNGAQDLVCPEGTLLTQVHDGHLGAEGIQRVQSVVCCELDLISSPSKAPTTSPTTSPSPSPTTPPSPGPTTAPSPSPTSAPSPGPTKAPSTSPTTAPSPSPTSAPSPGPTKAPSTSPTTAPSPAPTSTSDCLLALFQCDPPLNDAEILQGIDDCLPDCVVPYYYHRRVLEGRLLSENAE